LCFLLIKDNRSPAAQAAVALGVGAGIASGASASRARDQRGWPELRSWQDLAQGV